MNGVIVVRSLLVADTGVTALVPAVRIVAGMLPQGTTIPAISLMSVSSTDRNIAAPGPNRRVSERVQVTVLAASYPAAKAITVWADIQPLSGREARIADRVSAELTHQITVRHRPDLDDPQAVSRMRVLFRSRTFAIHAALNDDEANVSVILLASEGIRDG